MKKWPLLIFLILFANFFACKNQNLSWPPVQRETLPGVYWWWMGSAVDKSNLRYNLENLHRAGIGGVTVVPIYGVHGYEDQFIDYLTPRWMSMLDFAVQEANRLGMWVDMTTGTGWPFGGAHITPEFAAKKMEHRVYFLSGGGRLKEKIDPVHLQALVAYSAGGEPIDLTDRVHRDSTLNWVAPAGKWRLDAVWMVGTGQKVKRAAPGNEGLVINPYSTESLAVYLKRFDRAFAGHKGHLPRAQYHDSFEYYNANWTRAFFDSFRVRRGYDLRAHLPLLFGSGQEDAAARVQSDYRQTLADLHLRYIQSWVKWAHAKGCWTRNQAHGAPGNLLDLYAAADIPETEIFGSTPFPIPGFRRKPENNAPYSPNPLVLRFASSAAHVAGRQLVASETCTWLREHFKVALSQVKPEVDQLFLAGVNHIFYHGSAYSPREATWPGWLFYASTAFQPVNAIWRDFPALNRYVTRCQSFLQWGQPDNPLLLYWPIFDVWHRNGPLLEQMGVHDLYWLKGTAFARTARFLLKWGVAFDYVSDRQVQHAACAGGKIRLSDLSYQTLVVPPCKHISLATWNKLLDLASAGATVIFQDSLPADVPGFGDLARRRGAFQKSKAKLRFVRAGKGAARVARVGKGRLLLGVHLEELLRLVGVRREPLTDTGLGFVRRQDPDGHHYFIANLSDHTVDGWVPLAVPCVSAALFDPLTGKSGVAGFRRTGEMPEIYLQLEPGQSLLVKTFRKKRLKGPAWPTWQKRGAPFPISGRWQVDFLAGGPRLPASFTTRELKSWTLLGDDEARRFAGTARYTIRFNLPKRAADNWLLDLGDVRESARVKINGKNVGVLWSLPFEVPVGAFLRPRNNRLEVEVTNLSANRIRDLDRRRVKWKNFYDINYVNIRYEKFDATNWPLVDSGLLGPVRLWPLKKVNVDGRELK